MKLNIQLFASGSYTFTAVGNTYTMAAETGNNKDGNAVYKYRVLVKLDSYDAVTNKSTITVTYQKYSSSNWSYSGQHNTFGQLYIKIGSADYVKLSDKVESPKQVGGEWTQIVKKTTTISHNADGTSPVIRIKGVFTGNNTAYYAPASKTIYSDNITLVKIPRASIIKTCVPTISLTQAVISASITKYVEDYTTILTLYDSSETYELSNNVTIDSGIGDITFTMNLSQTNIVNAAADIDSNTIQYKLTATTYNTNSEIIGTPEEFIGTITIPSPDILDTTYSIDPTTEDISFTPTYSAWTSGINNTIDINKSTGETIYVDSYEDHPSEESFTLDSSEKQLLYNLMGVNKSLYYKSTVTSRLMWSSHGIYPIGNDTLQDKELVLPDYTLEKINSSFTECSQITINGHELSYYLTNTTNANNHTKFIKNFSRILFNMSARKTGTVDQQSAYGRDIYYRINNNIKSSGYEENYTGTPFIIEATTGRDDLINITPGNIIYIPYQNPTLNYNIVRWDKSSGSASQSGTSAKITIGVSYYDGTNMYTNNLEDILGSLSWSEDNWLHTNSSNFDASVPEGWTRTTSTNPTTHITTDTYTYIIEKFNGAVLNYNKPMKFSISFRDKLYQYAPSITNRTLEPGRPGMYGYKNASGVNYTVINDNEKVDGSSDIQGNQTIAGNLTVNGTTQLNNTNISGELSKNSGYYPAYRGSISDANNAISQGYYQTGVSTANLPTETTNKYGYIQTIISTGNTWNKSTNWIWQIYKNTYNEEFTRFAVNAGNFNPWVKVSSNGVAVNATNASNDSDGNNIKNTYEHKYDIGDICITNTNTNPSSIHGGTWELVDKEFSSYYTTAGTAITWNSTNTTAASCVMRYTKIGHSLNFSFTIVNKVQIKDDTLAIGTLKLANLGIDQIPIIQNITGWTDGGNCAVFFYISQAGAIETRDIIPNSYVSAGSTIFLTFTVPINLGHMLDSACDKFYWKKTAN